MLTVLFIVIFTSYIGLGLPDSLIGAAWPAVYSEFGLPISYVSFITVLISLGTVTSSFLSAKIIKVFGTAGVVAVSTVMTAAALFGFSLAPNIIWMCVAALPLGLGAGAVDTALNNYVALNFKPIHINFLHCFYGIGVSVSPYIMSFFLGNENNWRGGYRFVALIQSVIALTVIATVPVWKKVNSKNGGEEQNLRIVSVFDVLKNGATRTSIGVFLGSCAIECICLSFGSTFFVESKGASADTAAKMITLYFVGMTLGRFVSGLAALKLQPMTIVFIGQGITLAAVILLFIPSGIYLPVVGLSLVGFGNGAVFPNMSAMTPDSFGKEVSQSVIGIQMGFAYISILLTPLLFGFFAQRLGTGIFPYALLFAFVLMEYSTVRMQSEIKKKIML